jgi:hypothetical protein
MGRRKNKPRPKRQPFDYGPDKAEPEPEPEGAENPDRILLDSLVEAKTIEDYAKLMEGSMSSLKTWPDLVEMFRKYPEIVFEMHHLFTHDTMKGSFNVRKFVHMDLIQQMHKHMKRYPDVDRLYRMVIPHGETAASCYKILENFVFDDSHDHELSSKESYWAGRLNLRELPDDAIDPVQIVRTPNSNKQCISFHLYTTIPAFADMVQWYVTEHNQTHIKGFYTPKTRCIVTKLPPHTAEWTPGQPIPADAYTINQTHIAYVIGSKGGNINEFNEDHGLDIAVVPVTSDPCLPHLVSVPKGKRMTQKDSRKQTCYHHLDNFIIASCRQIDPDFGMTTEERYLFFDDW